MKSIPVKEVYQLHGKASITIPEDAALDYVVALLGHEPRLQGVFMVDSNQRYVGMISRFDLLKWTQAQLYGEKQKTEIQLKELLQAVKAKQAKDIEIHNGGSQVVRENDSLQVALDLMISYQEDILPVIDRNNKIIGDLSLSELLSKALEIGIQSQL